MCLFRDNIHSLQLLYVFSLRLLNIQMLCYQRGLTRLFKKLIAPLNLDQDLQFIIMELVNPKPLPLQEFIASISTLSLQNKYFQWQNYLNTLKETQSPSYQATLEKFLEHFPYNHSFWKEIVELALKVPKTGKGNAVRLYQLALAQNPRSITLWGNYLQWLKKQISGSDPAYLKKEYDKAIKIIGNHFKAGFIFQAAFDLELSAPAKYLILKKAMVSPLQQIDLLYDLAASWIDDKSALPLQSLITLVQNQGITSQNQAGFRLGLKSQLRRLYQPSKRHVEQREVYQNMVCQQLSKVGDADEYLPHRGKIQAWRAYISWLKSSGNPQLVAPLYERALITNCDNESLWQQYFLILQNQSNFQRALYIFRSHSTFFRYFSKQLTYYWVQLEQRQNSARSRQIYLQLQSSEPHLQVFLRHIQMQIREKEFKNARTLYETLLTTFTVNPDILLIILEQYSELAMKYFRDSIDVRELLKSYFEAYPFHQGLFFLLLRHYKNNVEMKQGSRQSKNILDKFIQITVNGLRRALETSPDRYQYINKVARKIMRQYVGNIYTVKTAERKIKQMEMVQRRSAWTESQSYKRERQIQNDQ